MWSGVDLCFGRPLDKSAVILRPEGGEVDTVEADVDWFWVPKLSSPGRWSDR
jgi:hypothetical protein